MMNKMMNAQAYELEATIATNVAEILEEIKGAASHLHYKPNPHAAPLGLNVESVLFL